MEKLLAEPDLREKFATFAYEPFILNRQQFNAYIQAESTRFGAIIQKAQVSLD
jgi:tripartite-type tricarboxylate transporter receptor subunit TctC